MGLQRDMLWEKKRGSREEFKSEECHYEYAAG